MAQQVKNPPAMQEIKEAWGQFLGLEDPLEKALATHSSILAWKNPMDRRAWWLQSMGYKESDPTE